MAFEYGTKDCDFLTETLTASVAEESLFLSAAASVFSLPERHV